MEFLVDWDADHLSAARQLQEVTRMRSAWTHDQIQQRRRDLEHDTITPEDFGTSTPLTDSRTSRSVCGPSHCTQTKKRFTHHLRSSSQRALLGPLASRFSHKEATRATAQPQIQEQAILYPTPGSSMPRERRSPHSANPGRFTDMPVPAESWHGVSTKHTSSSTKEEEGKYFE